VTPFESLDYIYVPAPDIDAAVRFYAVLFTLVSVLWGIPAIAV
jgi:hypothetical protein